MLQVSMVWKITLVCVLKAVHCQCKFIIHISITRVLNFTSTLCKCFFGNFLVCESESRTFISCSD